MRPSTILQIVPSGGGVQDYAQRLTEQWEALGVACHTRAIPAGAEQAFGFAAWAIAEFSRVLNPVGVVLHFSGYGYAKRGLCFWVPRELERLKAGISASGASIAVVFHEIYANGPPWSTAFWTSIPQRSIAAKLAALPNLVWTNTQRNAQWLERHGATAHRVECHAVFSNVGEPNTGSRSWTEREKSAIVFGSEDTRRRLLARLRARGRVAARALAGVSIVEVGSGQRVIDLPGSRFAGKLPEADLSALLVRTRYGLVDYPRDYLAKSGVFAAYAAHGMLVCNVRGDRAMDTDGLNEGRHYVDASQFSATVDAHERVAGEVRAWYDTHRLAAQAQAFLECLSVS